MSLLAPRSLLRSCSEDEPSAKRARLSPPPADGAADKPNGTTA